MRCSHCDLELQTAIITYCPECHSMYSGSQNLHFDGTYWYGFVDNGAFTLIGKKNSTLPSWKFAKKSLTLISIHLFLTFVWFFLSYFTFSLLTVCVFIHLLVIGYYLTQLLIHGGFKELFFPPPWFKILISLKKTPQTLPLPYNSHPGFLLNLAIWANHNKNYPLSHASIKEALRLCPHHPHLQYISQHILLDT